MNNLIYLISLKFIYLSNCHLHKGFSRSRSQKSLMCAFSSNAKKCDALNTFHQNDGLKSWMNFIPSFWKKCLLSQRWGNFSLATEHSLFKLINENEILLAAAAYMVWCASALLAVCFPHTSDMILFSIIVKANCTQTKIF